MSENFNDLFAAAQSGGKFPKLEELEGLLVLIEPERIETVPNRFAKKPTDPQTQERLTADVVVFNEDGSTDEFDGMYLSQQVVVSAARNALKPGNKPMILAVPRKYPTKDTQEALKISTADEFAEKRAAWLKGGGKGFEPRHVWVLDEFTPEQADQARAYLRSRDEFAAPPAE